MFLKSIKLYNWKQFDGKHKFEFSNNINFIVGGNGIGKSNLTLKSILFALYGQTDKIKLADAVTKGKKSAFVELEMQKSKTHYFIKREIPSKLHIIQNHTEVEWKENGLKEKDKYIEQIFGNLVLFKRFRIVDGYDKDVNFLEQGNTTLKKILSSINESVINDIRSNLLSKKNEISTYNKKNIRSASTHYYSESRLEALQIKLEMIETEIQELDKEIRNLNGAINKLNQKKGVILAAINETMKQIKKANQTVCYACKQPLPQEKQAKLKEKAYKEQKEAKEKYAEVEEEIKELVDIAKQLEQEKRNKINRKMRTSKFLAKLEELRDLDSVYIYTEKDEINIKKAIAFFDNFTSEYLVYSIKTLEPIINSVLEKINFRVEFGVSKTKFNLKLKDNKDRTWNYGDLSTGQKLLLQIAMKSAVLLQNNESGLIVADEGLGSLDEENLQYIIELFNELPFQLIMVLHHFKGIPDFVNVIDLNNYFKK